MYVLECWPSFFIILWMIILVCHFLPAGEGQTYKDKEQN